MLDQMLMVYKFLFHCQGFKDSGSLYFECYIEESGADGEPSAEVCFLVFCFVRFGLAHIIFSNIAIYIMFLHLSYARLR